MKQTVTVLWIILFTLMVGQLCAQQPLVMNVFNSTPYGDENGTTLEDGDILHVLWAGADGTIDPPVKNIGGANNGQPTGDDELLSTHVIGENFPPGFGQFSFTVTTYQNQTAGKPAAGDWVYLRGFNSNSLVTATYYGDAQLYQVQCINGETYDPLIDMSRTDQTLPVELSAFEAIGGDGEVSLKWRTQSEVNNLGFEIFRSLEETGEYALIATYEDQENLVGAGNANEERQYSYKDLQIANGVNYWYKIADVDFTGVRTLHGPVSAIPNANQTPLSQKGNAPTRFMLHQNYPNPFNPETTIKFELPDFNNTTGKVELLVFNALGMKVRTLYDGPLAPGIYETQWNGRDDEDRALSSGIYFAFFKAGPYSSTIKLLLVR